MTFINIKKTLLILIGCLSTVCLLQGLGIDSYANGQSPRFPAMPGHVHEKSLSVITVGSGVPGPFADRAEAMTVIQTNGRYIVLDCGYTSVLKMMKNGLALGNIDIFLFTHLHADHSTDFFNLMIWRSLFGGKELEIIGPPRTSQLYEFFRNFYRDDIIYRYQAFDIKTSEGTLTGVNVNELTGSRKLKIGDIAIESAEMIHTMYDLAYKFTIDGKTIVVSGDTSYTENLVKLSKNTDLLVLDGISIIGALRSPKGLENMMRLGGEMGKKEIDGKIPEPLTKHAGNFTVESHLNYKDLVKIVAEAKPGKVLLTHLGSSFITGGKDPYGKELQDKVLNDLKEAGFEGEVYFAKDGMEVNP